MTHDCCCCGCPSTPTEPTDPGGGTPPQSDPRCELYQVTIVSINVTDTDDGFLGGDLEATFTFTVNGESRTYVNNDLGEGTHSIGVTFLVPVPAVSSTISISVSGEEDDPIFNDTLAGFTRVWGQADNWGVGSQSGSASDSNITYSLNYTITCAEPSVASVSRAALLSYGQLKAKQRKVKGISETTLVGWSVDRLRRDGWEVMQISDKEYVLKGVGKLPAMVERQLTKRK